MKPIRGFALVSALFILVVLVALGTAIVTVTSSQHIGSAQDIEGVRAYQAARAGIEWGLYQVNSTPAYQFSYGSAGTVGSALPDNRNCDNITDANRHFPVFGFTVSVTCTQYNSTGTKFTTTSTGIPPYVYSLTAIACNQPTGGACPNQTSAANSLYIERKLEVVF